MGIALWLFYPLIHPQYLAHKINVCREAGCMSTQLKIHQNIIQVLSLIQSTNLLCVRLKVGESRVLKNSFKIGRDKL